jgi:Family of unknown function (DUF5695)
MIDGKVSRTGRRYLSHRLLLLGKLAALLTSTVGLARGSEAAEPTSATAESPFEVEITDGAIVSLRYREDRFDTDYIADGRRLGDAFLRYRTPGGQWHSVNTEQLWTTNAATFSKVSGGRGHQATYKIAHNGRPAVVLRVQFEFDARAILWSMSLKNIGEVPLEFGDFAVPLPMNSFFRRGQPTTAAVLKHSFISGHGSFMFWMRSNSAGPYLTLTPLDDTKLEYWDMGQPPNAAQASSAQGGRRNRVFRAFIHSTAAGADAASLGGKWRQPHTSLTLAPKGKPGDAKTYGFKLQWGDSYDGVRQLLLDEGQIDVHVVPGMTIPIDLAVRFALRTRHDIAAIEAEFPESTKIEPLGQNGDDQLYEVRFERLGENRLAVRYGDGRHMYLEFFVTEPIETLIKKRAAFISRCQHRDPSKWYNGLISEWNMETQTLLGPDNYDRISGFRIYAVTCDDPGLSKPAFLAAKNAEYPVPSEVEALDYYIEHFVWGGLQRTTDETYSYGIYGIQDWKRNRESDDPGRDGQLHIWRCYDYPHVILMYYSMYRVAKDAPHIKTALTTGEYLDRAYGTALAMFTVPREVEGWSAYRTGFYNELVIVDLIEALDAAGRVAEAAKLREHWERKVRYFVEDAPNLFVSEYPFDSTGFESTHALAKYALRHSAELADQDLPTWNKKARQFMDTQIAANIFCRGSLEPAYCYLGSDYRQGAGNSYTLTYMSQMGGWAVLDYALHFAADPAPYLRLGYASYLSAWALVNSGTPESNYGYWYPGEGNDGGAGGGFEPAAYGRTWLGQPHHRGSWYYACEIDLGFCGALRAAATVLADDPIFGRFCFGGDWQAAPGGVEITPKDGLRRRLHTLLFSGKVFLELDRGRFAAGEPVFLAEDRSDVRFILERDNPQEHSVNLVLSGLAPGEYMVRRDGDSISTLVIRDNDEVSIELPVMNGGHSHAFTVSRSAAAP